MYDLPGSLTRFAVTGFMLASVGGLVIGGFMAAQAERLELLIGASLAGSAVLLLLVGSGWLSGYMALAVTTVAGVGYGMAGPSRDMLIRRATPPGATGRVYGTVYSGLDLGFALAAPIFGALLDHGAPSAVFYGAALTLVMGVLSASLVGWQVTRVKRSVKVAA
jgi:MFS family permease